MSLKAQLQTLISGLINEVNITTQINAKHVAILYSSHRMSMKHKTEHKS